MLGYYAPVMSPSESFVTPVLFKRLLKYVMGFKPEITAFFVEIKIGCSIGTA